MVKLDLPRVIASPGTRTFEREQLVRAQSALDRGENHNRVLAQLEASLRPLALRNNLTPDVADLYLLLIHDPAAQQFDFAAHRISDVQHEDRAIFAGGCFWCMVEPFETMPGIVSVLSGYTGGTTAHPTYEQVKGGHTGHVEAVEVIFDTRQVNYDQLLQLYWQLSDPTDNAGQFSDRGANYRPVIFTTSAAQMAAATAARAHLAAHNPYRQPILTDIRPATTFWPAENYHQQFYRKFPQRAKHLERERKQYLFWKRVTGKLLPKITSD